MNQSAYVHGYNEDEATRLQDQAATLVDLLHADTRYPAGSQILEAGCGVGAQTITLAGQNPDAHITAVDISAKSIAEAKHRIDEAGITNVTFQQADIFNLEFAPQTFDHIFVCFVLEHLPEPQIALQTLARFLKVGGSITVIEGDHGSAYFHPDSDDAQRVIDCQIRLQAQAGGNANIGRGLYPLLAGAGFKDVHVSPRMVYVDGSRPQLIEGFTRKTFTAMIAGIRERAIDANLIDEPSFDAGVAALYETATDEGTFCYTFFKARGVRRDE